MNFRKLALYVGIFFIFNWLDYKEISDVFRDGKLRYLFFCMAPISFIYFRKHLSWAPAIIAALAIFSFAIHDYMLYSCFPLLIILATLGASVAVVKQGKDFFANILLVTGLFESVVALLQVCGVHLLFRPIDTTDLHSPIGFIGNPTILGPMLVACLCPALWRKHYLSASIMAVAAIATTSSMTYAALAVVLVVYLWQRSSFIFASMFALLAAVPVSLAYVFVPNHPIWNLSGRAFIWSFGMRAVSEHPLFGVGIGGWVGIYIKKFAPEILPKFFTHLPYNLHNDYLDFVVEYGLVAAGVLAIALFQFLYNFKPTWTHAICAGLLVNAAANFPLSLPPTAIIMAVAWAHSAKYGKLSIEEIDV